MHNEPEVRDWTEIKVGEEFTAAYVICDKVRRNSRRGDFLALTLSNELGQKIAAKVWAEHCDAFDEHEVGDALLIKGKVEKGWPPDANPPPELKVVAWTPIVGPHLVREMMNPSYPGDLEELESEFDAYVAMIRDPGYRRFVELTISGDTRKRFFRAPAATHYHHNYLGGLAEHTIEVVRFSLAAAQAPGVSPHVDQDLVISGALLHDLGKLDEYAWEGVPIGRDRRAFLYNHIIGGPLRLVEAYLEHAQELEPLGFSREKLDQLIHIQASHHGQIDWGANVVPATIAAQCVHQGDLMSAYLRGMTNNLESLTPNRDGVIMMGRRAIIADPRSDYQLAQVAEENKREENAELSSPPPRALEKALEAANQAVDQQIRALEEPVAPVSRRGR